MSASGWVWVLFLGGGYKKSQGFPPGSPGFRYKSNKNLGWVGVGVRFGYNKVGFFPLGFSDTRLHHYQRQRCTDHWNTNSLDRNDCYVK